MITFLNNLVPGASSTVLPSPHSSLWHPTQAAQEQGGRVGLFLTSELLLPGLAAALAALPVFVQAPWVRLDPFGSAVFTFCLLLLGIVLAAARDQRREGIGALLVGFSGSWLGGCLFWGWFRLHPVMHLPIEAFALPLALAGLSSRWRLAAAFYLASLVGTASTDAVMAMTDVIRLWPQVLTAPVEAAPGLLSEAAMSILTPLHLPVLAAAATGLLGLGRLLWKGGEVGRVAAAVLVSTLVVDGLFLGAALISPRLSGLI